MFATDTEKLIDMQLHRLDCYAVGMESKWGVGNLISYADDTLKALWYDQNEKLAAAVEKKNYGLVCQLVDGTIKGWDALEANATKLGKETSAPEFMEVKLDSGFHLRIANSVSEANRCMESDVIVFSLKEVARLIESTYRDVYGVKRVFPDAVIEDVIPFDFKKGDKIPF